MSEGGVTPDFSTLLDMKLLYALKAQYAQDC